MAAMKQCVACNRQIPESWTSCQCGHVLTETRTIAGKRFSDYRAELYTRLVIEESRKQARKPRVRRNPTAPKAQQREKSRSPNMFRGRRRKRTRPLLLRREPAATAGQRQREAAATARNTEQPDKQITETTAEHVNMEQTKQSNKSFTSALAEINKRLQNQSKLWACLASGLPLSANT